jgi:hypothetical protein
MSYGLPHNDMISNLTLFSFHNLKFILQQTLTATLVSLSQINDPDKLERAFAASTAHDMFNYMSVAIFFPIEVATQFLARVTALMVKNAHTESGDTWQVRVLQQYYCYSQNVYYLYCSRSLLQKLR